MATQRTFTIQRAGTATFTATVSGDNPVPSNHETDTTDGAQDIELLRFKVKATVGDGVLTKLAANFASAGAASNILPTIAYLKEADTGNVISSANPSTGVGTFENFTRTIKKGEQPEFIITGDFPAPASAVPASSNNVAQVTIPTTSASSQFLRVDGATVNVTMPGAGIVGSNQNLFTQGLQMSLISATAVGSNLGLDSDKAVGILTFKVEPFGGSLTKFRFASLVASATTTLKVAGYDSSGVAINTASVSAVTITTTPDTNTPDGSSATVVVQMTIADGPGVSYRDSVLFKVDFFDWTVGTTSADQGTTYQAATIGMTDNWKTPYVFIP